MSFWSQSCSHSLALIPWNIGWHEHIKIFVLVLFYSTTPWHIPDSFMRRLVGNWPCHQNASAIQAMPSRCLELPKTLTGLWISFDPSVSQHPHLRPHCTGPFSIEDILAKQLMQKVQHVMLRTDIIFQPGTNHRGFSSIQNHIYSISKSSALTSCS